MDGLARAALTSASLGLAAAAVSVIAALIWLETTSSATVRRAEGVMYLPLLIPQIAFLFGFADFTYLAGDGRAASDLVMGACGVCVSLCDALARPLLAAV